MVRNIIVTLALALISGQMTVFCNAEEIINPYPRLLVAEETVLHWDFDKGLEGWRAGNDCSLAAQDGSMRITSSGTDPYLYSSEIEVKTPAAVRLRLRANGGGAGRIYFLSRSDTHWSEKQAVNLPLAHDGKWRVVQAAFPPGKTITRLRFDPGSAPGVIKVDWIEIIRPQWHPLEIESVRCGPDTLTVHLCNHEQQDIAFISGGQKRTIRGKEHMQFTLPLPGEKFVQPVTVQVQVKGLPMLERTVFVYQSDAQTGWRTLRSGDVIVRVCPDGSAAELISQGQTAAILGPVVHYNGRVPKLVPVETGDNNILRFQGDNITIQLSLVRDELTVEINSTRQCEGPVVRALGELQQGLFAGLEYLGKGEHSSSKLDIETEEHLRYEPDTWKVTMPLMACVTDRAAIALTWQDMNLQPVYAVPNFFDGSNDHRMSLKGKHIEATILVRHQPLSEIILWAVQKRRLPKLPTHPRSWQQQKALCLASFNGPIGNQDGWGHCAEDHWPRRPYADIASTIWRISDAIPKFDHFQTGGGHIRNESIYFVTGQAKQWLAMKKGQVHNYIERQATDGSYHYDGKYRRGHFENTASGLCALPAAQLLEFAHLTGDKAALTAGLKTLEYMKRFHTPRGAQTWECALHTPDILASAYLVWAYVRGYELTGRADLLAQARRWALSGVPFVYQWSRAPMMLYATIAVYGATNWVAPNWMGRPVQWCGTVYAYALLMLAPYDKSLDWRQLATGILISGEQQQYESGPLIGCLPDSFDLHSGKKYPWSINPSALISLRLLIRGELDALSTAVCGKHRLVAPFPITIHNRQAIITAPRGIRYQILVDGNDIIDITSHGRDILRDTGQTLKQISSFTPPKCPCPD